MKDEDFEDVTTCWMQYQVVIHTSSVTAGISFEEKHFDYQINVFNTNTCDSGSFFQGMHRVRNISSKQVITFVEVDNTQQITAPSAYSDLETDTQHSTNAIHVVRIDQFSQLIAWLKAREGCNAQFRLQLLLKYMKQMEYRVSVEAVPEDATKGLV